MRGDGASQKAGAVAEDTVADGAAGGGVAVADCYDASRNSL
jgi:hypothetical protein